MELARLMKERRSVHVFEDRPVPQQLLEQILDTAVWVPNHKMTQPWRFILVIGEGRRRFARLGEALAAARERNPDKRAEFARKFYDKMMAVPAFLIVVMKEDPQLSVREEDYASTSCIIHNIGLLAWEQGLGLVWETYGFMHSPQFREALGICPGEKTVGSLHIGYPAKIPPAQPRIPAAERLTILNTY